MNIVISDIVLLLILLVSVIIGIKKGFFMSLPRIVRYLVALCLTICVSAYFINNYTGPYFSSMMTEKINEYLITNCPEINAYNAAEVMPRALLIFGNMFGVSMPEEGSFSGAEFISKVSTLIGEPLGRLIAMLITYVVLFIIFSLLIKIFLKICDSIFSHGILGVINKIVGGIIGAAIGCVVSCIIANIIANFVPQFAGGVIYEFFLHFNPLAILLSF